LKKAILLPALYLSLLSAAQPGWKQELKYRLQATLDDRQRALDGNMELLYRNHSPDTLHFIWLQVWPNAYRNDRTSYSEQLLGNGKTGFYFSDQQSKGYINRMEFRVNGILAETSDHPEYLDVIRLMLPSALKPGDSLLLSASFHVKLPYDFSGFGYRDHLFEISNWYPEPAVYDHNGWHPMPFLEQGGAYHEPAGYEAAIRVPDIYTVASGCPADSVSADPAGRWKTYHFSIPQANAFAWVAGRQLVEKKDSVLLEGGKTIGLLVYYFPSDSSFMISQLPLARSYIRQLSSMISPYPYASLSLVETRQQQEQGFSGMVLMNRDELYRSPEKTLREGLAAQWFRTICLSNERAYPWMSKGFIQYYSGRLEPAVRRNPYTTHRFNNDTLWLRVALQEKTAQPLNTKAADFSRENYDLVAGTGAAYWIRSLEDSLGRAGFDRSMQAYFTTWAFAHPGPEDLHTIFSKTTGRSLENSFAQLDGPGFYPEPGKKMLKAGFLFSTAHSERYRYIGLAPAFGYNRYDDLMVGMMIHNYNLPENRFQFLAIPLYSYSAKFLEGIGRADYSWYPEGLFRRITLGLSGSRSARNDAKDSSGTDRYERFSKLVPSLRFELKKSSARNTLEKWMDIKSYLINEKYFSDFAVSSKDSLIHPNSVHGQFRYLNQLSINLDNPRVLYPYSARLELQQSDLFYRINLSGYYFFNYPAGGGMQVRLFAAKFGEWHNRHQDLSRYEPKLLGTTGDEDYTYDQYFIGRSASDAIENSSVVNNKLAARQIFIRDGGLKLRIDAYDYVQGRSANWVSALNFSSTLPPKLFPVPLPVRLFFDIGTYSEAWKANAPTSRFLYAGGIQLSLFRNLLNIYAPLVYSSDFRDVIKTESFWEKLTFSVDIQRFDRKKLLRKIAGHD
jgi:hypothetical protein